MTQHKSVHSPKILLCTDLDRTLIPNGLQAESPAARLLFQKLTQRPEVVLIYVSGRSQWLLKKSIQKYKLPQPSYAITDVGTSIYSIENSAWHLMQSWHKRIGKDWPHTYWGDLANAIGNIHTLHLQRNDQQAQYKLSYEASPARMLLEALPRLKERLCYLSIPSRCIDSIDETLNQGLIDILPENAGKRPAIDFLVDKLNADPSQVFFSGDSGNDLDVLVSSYCATVVKNATAEIKQTAIEQSQINGVLEKLYLANGLTPQFNGNYAAGIIEGFMHFFPESKSWIKLPSKI